MKIFKIMAAAALAATTLLSSCGKQEQLGPASLKISAAEVTFAAEAGEQTFTFTATRDWRITLSEGAEAWLTVDPMTGDASSKEQTFTMKVLANPEYERSATLSLSILSGELALDTKTIAVKQAGEKVMEVGEGTVEKPYTVAQALELAGTLDASGEIKDVYIKGIISEIKNVDTGSFGNAEYYISDDGTKANQLLIYRGYYLGGAKFTSADQIKVNDEVVVFGTLVNFKGNTKEVTSGSKIYSLNGETDPGTDPGTGTGEGVNDDTQGTLDNPYSAQKALYLANQLTATDTIKNVYVKGLVSEITDAPGSNTYGNATYYLSGDGSKTNQFLIFRSKGIGGEDMFTDYFKLGDEIIVNGNIIKYKGETPEMTQGGKIYSLNGSTDPKGGSTDPGTGDGDTPEGTKISWSSAADWTGVGTATISFTSGEYTITVDKASGATNPTVNATANDCRAYANNTVTVTSTGANITALTFSVSAKGAYRLAPITADSGTIATQALGDKYVKWTGDAKTVVLTVGPKADFGSDGNTKAGQLCFDNYYVK